MATIEDIYICQDDDMFDAVIYRKYGREAVAAGAVEWIYEINQNLASEGLFTHAGLAIKLPKRLPKKITDAIHQQKQIRIFV